MDSNRVAGGLKQAAGRFEDAAGALAGDVRTQLDGKGRQVVGQVQGAYGEALDTVRAAFNRNPIGAVLAIAGVGLLLGLISSRR